MSCGIDTEANALFLALLGNEDFTIPDIDLDDPIYQLPGGIDNPIYQTVVRLTNEDVTTKTIDGSGSFDYFMGGFKVHLKEEYDKNRITGSEYAKAYVELNQSAMANGVQFALGKEQSIWAALSAQVAAITAVVQLQSAKVELARLRLSAANEKANYALTKAKLARESIDYCLSKFQLEELSPQQKALLVAQVAGQLTENNISSYNLTNMLPKQLETLVAQLEGIGINNDTASYNLSTVLPQNVSIAREQEKLVREQTEVQRAQTSNNRTDGLPVSGVLGKQKDLYTQQITSYIRNDERSAAKIFTDAWTVMKTIDEGLVPPSNFNNASLDTVLAKVKQNNGLS